MYDATAKAPRSPNVRLDEPLARELGRIAGAQGRPESEVARSLLGYGIEVLGRLEAQEFARPFSWQEEQEEEPTPASWRSRRAGAG